MAKKKPVVSKYGQWKYPGQETIIPNANGNITMQGVPYPVLGIDDLGNQQMMMPGMDYQFPGNSVYEIPMAKKGGTKKVKIHSLPKAQRGMTGKIRDKKNVIYNDLDEYNKASQAEGDSLLAATNTYILLDHLNRIARGQRFYDEALQGSIRRNDPASELYYNSLQNKYIKPRTNRLVTISPGASNISGVIPVHYYDFPETHAVYEELPKPVMKDIKPFAIPQIELKPQLGNIPQLPIPQTNKQRVVVNTPQGDKIRVQDAKTKRFINWEDEERLPSDVKNPTGTASQDFPEMRRVAVPPGGFAYGGDISVPNHSRQDGGEPIYVYSKDDPQYVQYLKDLEHYNKNKAIYEDAVKLHGQVFTTYDDYVNTVYSNAKAYNSYIDPHLGQLDYYTTAPLLQGGKRIDYYAFKKPTSVILEEESNPKAIDIKPLPMQQVDLKSGLTRLPIPQTNKQRVIINTPQGDKIRVQDIKTKRFINWEDEKGLPTDIENPTGNAIEDFPEMRTSYGKFANGGDISIPDLRRVKIHSLPKAQRGLATAADSSLIANHANDIVNFYKNAGYNKQESFTFNPEDREYLFSLIEKERMAPGTSKAGTKYKNGQLMKTASGQMEPVWDTDIYQKLDDYKFQQRENAQGILNMDSPMQLYDYRISPQYADYFNDNITIDNVGIYSYDKLAVTPWKKLSDKQKLKRVQKFGTSGTPYKDEASAIRELKAKLNPPKKEVEPTVQVPIIDKPVQIPSQPEDIKIPFKADVTRRQYPITLTGDEALDRLNQQLYGNFGTLTEDGYIPTDDPKYHPYNGIIPGVPKMRKSYGKFDQGGSLPKAQNMGTFKPSYDFSKSFAENQELNRRAQAAGWDSVDQYRKANWAYNTVKQKQQELLNNPEAQKFAKPVENKDQLYADRKSGVQKAVNQAYYTLSNPVEAAGHAMKYGYVPQGNLGNYGHRQDEDAYSGTINSFFNPFAWANAAYRFGNDVTNKDSWTTGMGALNMGADLAEALPFFGTVAKTASPAIRTFAEHPLVNGLHDVAANSKLHGPNYAEALFSKAANSVTSPLGIPLYKLPGINSLYKNAAYTIGKKGPAATRSLKDIKNSILKKVSGDYTGGGNSYHGKPAQNLLRQYIFGDAPDFIKSEAPQVGLTKYTKKYGPLDNFKLNMSLPDNESLDFFDLVPSGFQSKHHWKAMNPSLGHLDELTDPISVRNAFADEIRKRGTVALSRNSNSSLYTNADIAGHNLFITHDPAADKFSAHIQDIWKFTPEEYAKRYGSFMEDLTQYKIYQQAKLMEKAGKPFVLHDIRPFDPLEGPRPLPQNKKGGELPIAQKGTEWEQLGYENRVYTYKDDPEFFNSHARLSDNPRYNDWIKQTVYSGKWGYNPVTGESVRLDANQQATVDPITQNLAKDKRTFNEIRKTDKAFDEHLKEAERESGKAVGRAQSKAMVSNPAFYAPGVIGAAAVAPEVLPPLFEGIGGALATPLMHPVTGATIMPGLTGGAMMDAAFAAHGLKTIVSGEAIEPWRHAVQTGNVSDYLSAVGQNVITGLETLPITGPLVKTGLELSKPALDATGKFLTTQTPLKNIHNINPWAGKLGTYNRVVGSDAIADLQASGLVRSGNGAVTTMGGIPVSRPTAWPSFAKGSPRETYMRGVMQRGDTPYIISTDRPMAVSTLGRHGKGSTQFPVGPNGEYLTSFPASEATVYEASPNWLRGYQKVNTPKKLEISMPEMPLVGAPAANELWTLESLPGLHLESTVTGGPISKIVEPKTGLVNVEQALAIIGKESGGKDKAALVRSAIGENIPAKMDYNAFRKIVQDALIPLEKRTVDYRSNYGLGHIGYPSPRRSNVLLATENSENELLKLNEQLNTAKANLADIKGFRESIKNDPSKSYLHNASDEQLTKYLQGIVENAEQNIPLTITQIENNKKMLSEVPLENETLLFSNKKQFGRGADAHDNPPETLGHIHYLIDAENPTTAVMTQMQSDAFQGTHRVMHKSQEEAARSLAGMESHFNAMKANYDNAKLMPGGGYELPDGTQISAEVYRDFMSGQVDANNMLKAEVENFTQKSLLDKKHQERYLQEFVQHASEKGMDKVRIPTSQTAANIQGYNPMAFDPTSPAATAARNKIMEANRLYGSESQQFIDASAEYDALVKNAKPNYIPEQQTILKKYDQMPKTIKKTFGEDVQIVTDSKGNTWYEFNIPQNFREGKGEIKAFKQGGQLKRVKINSLPNNWKTK